VDASRRWEGHAHLLEATRVVSGRASRSARRDRRGAWRPTIARRSRREDAFAPADIEESSTVERSAIDRDTPRTVERCSVAADEMAGPRRCGGGRAEGSLPDLSCGARWPVWAGRVQVFGVSPDWAAAR
jgi:hypothetical protein